MDHLQPDETTEDTGKQTEQRPRRARGLGRLVGIAVLAAVCVLLALAFPPPSSFPDPSYRSWAYFFGYNLTSTAQSFLGGIVSGGIYAVWSAARLGAHLGRGIADWSAIVQDTGGAGGLGVAAGLLLPHALLEIPAILLVWAMSVRRGLWLVITLWRKQFRQKAMAGFRDDLRLLVVVAIPLLLVAAILEERANPFFLDRYVLGIGRHPAIGADHRIGPFFACSRAELSPRGDQIAAFDARRSRVLLLDAESGQVHSPSFATQGMYLTGSPSWSPSGRELAVIRYRGETDRDGLLIFDLRQEEVRVVRNQPYGECVRASWSPSDDVVACVLVQRHPREEKPATSNIWLVDLEDDRWRPVTTFGATYAIPLRGGLDWSPDGRRLAFVLREPATQTDVGGGSSATRYWLSLVDVDGASLRKLGPLLQPGPLAWSPDGKRIAVVESTSRSLRITPLSDGISMPAPSLTLIDVDSGQRQSDLARVSRSSPSWSPEGEYLVYLRLGTCIRGGPIPDPSVSPVLSNDPIEGS